MQVKVGRKYKANDIFMSTYSLKDEYIKLVSVSGGTVTIMNDDKSFSVRLDFFLNNSTEWSKSVESIPRSIEDWKTEVTQPVEPIVVKPVEPTIIKPVEPIIVKPVEPVIIKPVEPIVVKPVEPIVVKPIEPVVIKPVEPIKPAVQEDPYAEPYPYEDKDYPY